MTYAQTRLRWATLISGFLAISGALADVGVHRRLATQLPQLGHVGKPYSWTFAANTFSTDASGSDSGSGSGSGSGLSSSAAESITYKADGLPSWATFDAESRTFSGTPVSKNHGQSTVTVVATGSDGASARDTFELIVINEPAPALKMPLAPQLPHINSIGAQYVLPDGSQSIPLGWSFSLGFDGSSFRLPNWEKIYYTVTRGDGTPIPSWLSFNADTFTFDGLAPVRPDPSEAAFDVVITASNMRGYGGTSDSFRLVLSQPGALVLGHPLRSVNATAGSSFRYTVPTTGLQLFGKQAPQDDSISLAASIGPSFQWLDFDASSNTLSGTPPFNFTADSLDATTAQAVSIPLVFADRANHTTNTTLTLNVYPSIFTSESFPDVDAETGMPFNVSLVGFLRPPLDASSVQLNVTFDPAETASWFAFNTSTFFLSGRAPATAVLNRIKIKVDARTSEESEENSRTGSTTFFVALDGGDLNSSNSDNDTHPVSNGMTDRTRTALGASLGTIGGILLLFALILGCRRWVAEEEHDKEIYIHKDLGSFETEKDGKSPALSGKYIPHSQLRMSKGYNASQTKFRTSPYLEPTSILVAPVLSANPKANNGTVAWADGSHGGGAMLERVVVGDGGGEGSPALNEAVAAYRQAEAMAMSNAAHVRAERERPRQNGLLAALFSSKKPRRSSGRNEGELVTHGPYVPASHSAGLGLTGLGIGDAAEVELDRSSISHGGPESVGVGRMSPSRSRHTIQSRKSSWEEGIWHDGDPRAGPGTTDSHGQELMQRRDDLLASPESGQSLSSSAPSIPQRRGGANLLFGSKGGIGASLGPMRHRNGHINDSPAFQTTGTFDTSTSSDGGALPMSESRQRMFDEARSGLEQRVLSSGIALNTVGGGAAAAAMGSDGRSVGNRGSGGKDNVSVRQLGVRHRISVEESKLRSVSHAVSSEGAFDDADEDITSTGMHGSAAAAHDAYDEDEEDDVLTEELSTAEIVAAGRALTTDSATAVLAAAHRQSVLSYTTNHEGDHAVQGAAIFSESALKTVPTFSLRPEETMRAVGEVKTIRY